jgi:multidrug efflux system outer membrane protein
MAPWYKTPKTALLLSEDDATLKKISQLSWQEYFQSRELQRLIELALKNNYDLKTASLNIEIAQETHGVVRANLFPTINLTEAQTFQGVPKAFASFMPKTQYRANLSLTSYEVDLFGRLRSLKKSAWEDFLSSQENYKIVKIALIAETANSYVQLLLDEENLRIAGENLSAQSQRYEFTKLRYENGIDSQATLLNAEAIIENAKVFLETYKKLVAQDRHALMALTGIYDEKLLPVNNKLDDIGINEGALDFIPSKSLLMRPDIQMAEHRLKSANANIGAARAAFFPSISLTGSYGYNSRDLNNLLDSKSWNFSPQINLPIFSGGRNFANLEISHLRKKIEIVNYEKAIQNAFRESLDQFSQRESISEQLKSYDKILNARSKSFMMMELKQKVGSSSKLEILDGKITLLNTRQARENAKKDYISNLITLYKVLGGGSEIK